MSRGWFRSQRSLQQLGELTERAHSMGVKNLGRLTLRLAPTEEATPHDFIWAAGIYEGEGNINGRGYHGTCVRVSQKDTWILERLRALFGGSVSGRRDGCRQWSVSGARARGFAMSVYGLLSPRRQEQIRGALLPGIIFGRKLYIEGKVYG